MTNFLRVIFVITSVIIFNSISKAQLIINELMQSNITIIYDELHQFPDSWVELYNPGTESENLADYSIGLKKAVDKSYQLPNIDIPVGGYILIFCDKESTGLHTDFRLESNKSGAIYLFKDGEICDQVKDIAPQPAPNIAYGRNNDGSESWCYQLSATPGKANCGIAPLDILPQPIFSIPGQLIGDEPVKLTITIPEDAPEGTVILYTLDSSTPTLGSNCYTGEPIMIEGTTVVRAKLYCEGYLSPICTTHSFIKHYRELELPLVSIVTDNEMLYDSNMGILSYPNCFRDYRRPVNFEYFEPEQDHAILNQLCETRTGGGWTSRNREQKTFMVYANKRFGEKRLEHEFFPDQRPGVKDFKSIMLRNSGNDYEYIFMRDAAIHRVVGKNYKDIDWQADRLCVLYINGEYSGLRHIRERSNEDNVYTNHDGLEEVDMIENWKDLNEGTIDNYMALQELLSQDPTDELAAEYRSSIDIEEILAYHALNFYFFNNDWPSNNFMLWRPTAEGGKWRAIMKDMDYGLAYKNKSWNEDYLKYILDINKPGTFGIRKGLEQYTTLIHHLLSIKEFREIYIDQNLVFLADFLRPEFILEQMDILYHPIRNEWEKTCEVFQNGSNLEAFDKEYNATIEWAKMRRNAYYSHLTIDFVLGKYSQFEISFPEDTQLQYTINGIPANHTKLMGKWPVARKMTIRASGANVTGWIISKTINNSNDIITEEYDGEELSIEIPEDISLNIQPILGSEMIEEPRFPLSMTSGYLPVIYINTEYSKPVVDKETKIPATLYLDGSTNGRYPSVGSVDSPLALTISGRGNTTWQMDKKPYKLKFDKKQSLFGLPKSKHYVLIAETSDTGLAYMSGLEMGRQIGMDWTPHMEYAELVLNGEYEGIYLVTESVKIQDGRIDIFEQDDLNEDPTTVPYGWLIEVDSSDDVNQINFKINDEKILRITHHSPEELSTQQREWLTDEVNRINHAVYESDDEDEWLQYFDLESLVKYFIVSEVMHNPDTYTTSFYLHKDQGENAKWIAGPLWDFSHTLKEDDWVFNKLPDRDIHWIKPIFDNQKFFSELERQWYNFYPGTIHKVLAYADNITYYASGAYGNNGIRWEGSNSTASDLNYQNSRLKELVNHNSTRIHQYIMDKVETSIGSLKQPEISVTINGKIISLSSVENVSQIFVSDILGQTRQLPVGQSISVANLSNGVYMLSVQHNDGTKQIVKFAL